MPEKLQIQTHHIAWIFESAQEHFAKKIAEMELEIMRHEHFANDPLIDVRMRVRKTRVARVAELRTRLEEYRMVAEFCREGREKAVDVSAEEFAKEFKKSFTKGQ